MQKQDPDAIAREVLTTLANSCFGEHHPDGAKFGCVDSRLGDPLSKQYQYIRHDCIAAALPPPGPLLSAEREATYAFIEEKKIKHVVIKGHSFCGGAGFAIAFPDPKKAPSSNVRLIVSHIAGTGIDTVRFSENLVTVCEGNKIRAANLLSRHIAANSAANFLAYGDFFQRVVNRQLNITIGYMKLRQGSGKPSSFEQLNLETGTWENEPHAHMCEKKCNEKNCASCTATIQTHLQWVPIQAAKDGKIITVQVPKHLVPTIEEGDRKHVENPQHNGGYRPGLLKLLQKGGTPLPRTIHLTQATPQPDGPC